MLRYMIGREQGIPAISCATGGLQGARLYPRKAAYRLIVIAVSACGLQPSLALQPHLVELTLFRRHTLQRPLHHRGACDRGFDAAFKFPAATCKPHRVKPSTTTQLQPNPISTSETSVFLTQYGRSISSSSSTKFYPSHHQQTSS